MKILIFLLSILTFSSQIYSQNFLKLLPTTRLAKRILKESDVYVVFQGKTLLKHEKFNTFICPNNKDYSWYKYPEHFLGDSIIYLQLISKRNCIEIGIQLKCLKDGAELEFDCRRLSKDWVSSTVKSGPVNIVNGFRYYPKWKFWKRSKCSK